MPRSLAKRLLFSHVLVATLTSLIGLTALVALFTAQTAAPTSQRVVGMVSAIGWLYGMDEAQMRELNMPPGSTVVINHAAEVVYSTGTRIPCQTGDSLVECAPELASATGERQFVENGIAWNEMILPTVTGYRVISRYPAITTQALALSLVIPSVLLAVLSMPVALLLARLTSGGLVRRLAAIAQANHRFAEGDFDARVRDARGDEVGHLAQQFDSMADILAQNVHLLRDLAQRNAALTQQAETSAVQSERTRLARDLHDSIAQRLFGLSVNTATLPDLIEHDPRKAVEQARHIAAMAEQAQLDLRALLVDLRPSAVIHRGLADALGALCETWSAANRIPAECELVLRGGHLPAAVEDVLYRAAEEALSNIAKHAHARIVHVSVLEGQRKITLSITDDGRGFDPAAAPPGGHFGLMGMRERVRAVGGALDIESEPGRGTTLRIVLPLERTEA